MRQGCTLLLAAALLSSPFPLIAEKAPPDPLADPTMIRAGFLDAHSDLRYRMLGLEKYKDGHMADAARFFRRAAFYADKPSQGMLAEMYWTGKGLAQDPVQGYIWMDLAAERGYAGFIGLRERYWAELDETQRKRAIDDGQAVYAEYGDDAAKPRMARVLRRERMNLTGSRTGFTGNVKILVPGPGESMEQIDGSKFYDERYWDPVKYQQWQDAVWREPRIGKVQVGAPVKAATEGGMSRVPATAPRQDVPEPPMSADE